jgi:glucose-6-phosphate isomerase
VTSRIIIFSILAIIATASVIGRYFYNLLKGHKEWKDKVKNTPVDRAFKTKQNFIDHYLAKGYSVNSINFVYDQTQKFLNQKT